MTEKKQIPLQPEIEHSPYDLDVKMLYNGRGFRKVETLNTLKYTLSDGREFYIPSKIQLDGRTAPILLRGFFPQFNKALRAWLLHDYMYRTGWGTRKQADIEMYKLAIRLNPGKWYTWPYWDNKLSYWYVRLVGSKVYRGKK